MIIERALHRERPLRLQEVRGSAGAYLVAQLRARHPGPILAIVPDSSRAERFAADLRSFAGGSEAPIFPSYDTPPFDRFSPHPEIESRRMSLLYRLLSASEMTDLTLVAPWPALMRRVLPRAELRARVTHLERGMRLDRDAMLAVLVSAGYHHTSLVEERGEVAARGGILDLFPPQLERPVRVELEFEEIGSIRHFDPATQRSSGELRSVVAIPPRGCRLPSDLDQLVQRVRAMGRSQGLPESNIYAVTEAIARRGLPPAAENLEALLHESLETVFDYLPGGALVVVDDPESGQRSSREFTEEVFQGHVHARQQDRLVCDPLSLYLTDDTAWESARLLHPISLEARGGGRPDPDADQVEVGARDHRELRQEIVACQGTGRALEPLAERLRAWQQQRRRVRISCPSLSAAERFVDILGDYDQALEITDKGGLLGRTPLPEPGRTDVVVSPLTEGFELPSEHLVVITEQDVFGARQRRRLVRTVRRDQAIERLAQIQEGDYLVHTEHGIGQFGGLVPLSVAGIAQEFLLVLYEKGDKLYLPVSRLAQIQRYSGADEKTPRLDRLGGQGWTRTKRRVRRAVKDMAQELLAVVAAREVLEGHGYPAPGADYEEFEARFPYEDTPDQRRASDDVLSDLQSPKPMDRLVCGDVGFGKTEVACRAAYVVTAEGRQVAFLVPTTVLCQQHLQTLRERFADTPVNVAALSRLSTPKEVRDGREGLASGRIDLVVGTHRLLSKDVQFRNLGLLVVDEEHRFGVAHKERIKQMRKLVEVLTLSATPIPRTLQMSFVGLRDLSLISTPPPDRVAIRTQVCPFSDDIIRDAIQRELHRGGQTFFVHNRVETIREIGEYLARIVPEARTAIAHGQMAGPQLEEVMLRFVAGEIDVLLCTAIIESGLDIPNANTILIHRVDQFGLAQLYQLRGRVGRSDRRAHAYLLLPPQGRMTDEARRRLDAIQELAELGSGFRLATEDLEIRGAGNLLGPEQSGNIASVGYDLYMEMLEQAIAELRGEGIEEAIEPEIRLPLAALLPQTYVEDANQRLLLYKQLSSARNDEDLLEIRDDLLDRFGPLPEEAQNLLEVIRLKIRCRATGIEAVDVSGRELVLRVHEKARLDATRLLQLLQQPDTLFRVTPDRRIYMELRGPADALAESFGLLDLLTPAEEGKSPARDAAERAGDSA